MLPDNKSRALQSEKTKIRPLDVRTRHFEGIPSVVLLKTVAHRI
jgi:hypothetical protein